MIVLCAIAFIIIIEEKPMQQTEQQPRNDKKEATGDTEISNRNTTNCFNKYLYDISKLKKTKQNKLWKKQETHFKQSN